MNVRSRLRKIPKERVLCLSHFQQRLALRLDFFKEVYLGNKLNKEGKARLPRGRAG